LRDSNISPNIDWRRSKRFKGGEPNHPGHFRQALDWARRQGALSWELRAATNLAQLWRNGGRSNEARELLKPVYDRFTDGFATADLRAAKSLIEEMV
jgi:predicted ATPase